MTDRNPYQPPSETSESIDPTGDQDVRGDLFSNVPPGLRPFAQVGTMLAIPFMGVFLFWQMQLSVWYGVYVLAYSVLIVPAVVVGRRTNQRQQNLSEYLGSFRISARLSSYLIWPLILGALINNRFWTNWQAVIWMVVIVMMSCLINVLVTSVCLLFAGENRTPLSWTYGALLLLYVAPPVITVLGFSSQFAAAEYIGVASPISAMLALPLDANLKQLFDGQPASFGNMTIVNGYFTFGAALSVMLVFAMLAGVRARQEDDQ